MGELDRVARNIDRMIDQSAPEADIDAYLQSEGFTPDNFAAAYQAARQAPPVPDGEIVHTQGRAIRTPEEERAFALEMEAKRRAGTFSDFDKGVTSAAQGISFGFADEAVGALAAPLTALQSGNSIADEYQINRDALRAANEADRTENPVRSTVTEIAGALPTAFVPLSAVGRMAQGGNTLARGAAGAGIGAAQGAVYGAGSAEEGERLEGAQDGAALGGVVGAAAPVVGRAVNAVGSKVLRGRSAKQALAEAPDTQTLRETATALFDRAHQRGVEVSGTSFGNFSKMLAGTLKREGIDPTLHPGATAALKRFAEVADEPVTLENLQTLRRVASGAARDFNNPDQQRLASKMVDALDGYIDNLTPSSLTTASGRGAKSAAKELREARAVWSRLRKTEVLEEAIEKGGLAKSGVENGLRSEFLRILKNKKLRRGFNQEELSLIRDVAVGTPTRNIMVRLSKLGFGTGQQTNMLLGSMGASGGAGVGFAVGGPVGAAVGASVPGVVGAVAGRGASSMARRSANLARATAARGSQKQIEINPEIIRAVELLAQRNTAVAAPVSERLQVPAR